MAEASFAYGSTRDVAALVPRFADRSTPPMDFTGETNPVKYQVESWINEISALLNAYLAGSGFTVPLTTTQAKALCTNFVAQEVAAIVEGSRGSGRFGPGNKNKASRYEIINGDLEGFLKAASAGLQAFGETRTSGGALGVGYHTDTDGDVVNPIFDRGQFGIADDADTVSGITRQTTP